MSNSLWYIIYMKSCIINDCIKPHHGKGMCKSHYLKWYYLQNKQKLIKNSKDYNLNNLKKVKERKVIYYQKNKDYIINKTKKYRKENIDVERSAKRRRRARIKNNGYEFYTEQQVLNLYGTKCYLCNTEIDMSAPRLVGKLGWQKGLHIEHVIDIAKGGPDTLANVRPAHALCNLTKKPIEMV